MTAIDEPPVVRVHHISKRFSRTLRGAQRSAMRGLLAEVSGRGSARRPDLAPHEFWALDDVSFELRRGEALGVIGANGAGKTTLLRLLHGISRPDFGSIEVFGKTGALIELGASFDASATGREAIEAEVAMSRLGSADAEGVVERALEFADLAAFIDAPLIQYSNGMKMRLGYAIAAALEPDVLIIDEVISVGDVAFQRKCLGFIGDFIRRGGSVVLASHDLWTLSAVCTRCMVLEHGVQVAEGTVDDVVRSYLRDHVAVGERSETWVRNSVVAEMVSPAADDPQQSDAISAAALLVDSEPALAPLDAGSESAVAIQRVSMRAVDGGLVEPLGPAIIEVELESSRPIHDARWTFSLTSVGHHVPLVQSRCPSSRATTIPAGTCRLAARIERLPLVGGTYLLRVLVQASGGAVVAQSGWLDDAESVEVVEAERFERTLFRISGVMVIAELDWRQDRPLETRSPGR